MDGWMVIDRYTLLMDRDRQSDSTHLFYSRDPGPHTKVLLVFFLHCMTLHRLAGLCSSLRVSGLSATPSPLQQIKVGWSQEPEHTA